MSQIKDLSGMRFGRLVVMKRGEDRIKPCGKKVVRWECKCDCGNEVTVSRDSLMSGNTKSCGCLHSEQLSERNVRNSDAELLGQKFGRLTVIGVEKNIKNTKDLKKRTLNRFILKAITKMQMVKNLVITKELP